MSCLVHRSVTLVSAWRRLDRREGSVQVVNDRCVLTADVLDLDHSRCYLLLPPCLKTIVSVLVIWSRIQAPMAMVYDTHKATGCDDSFDVTISIIWFFLIVKRNHRLA